MEDADKTMVKYLDYGLLNGHTLHLLANILNKVSRTSTSCSIELRTSGFSLFREASFTLIDSILMFFFLQVYNPILTYQGESEESEVVDGRRTPSSKVSNQKDAAQTEESEEEKRDEKV